MRKEALAQINKFHRKALGMERVREKTLERWEREAPATWHDHFPHQILIQDTWVPVHVCAKMSSVAWFLEDPARVRTIEQLYAEAVNRYADVLERMGRTTDAPQMRDAYAAIRYHPDLLQRCAEATRQVAQRVVWTRAIPESFKGTTIARRDLFEQTARGRQYVSLLRRDLYWIDGYWGWMVDMRCVLSNDTRAPDPFWLDVLQRELRVLGLKDPYEPVRELEALGVRVAATHVTKPLSYKGINTNIPLTLLLPECFPRKTAP